MGPQLKSCWELRAIYFGVVYQSWRVYETTRGYIWLPNSIHFENNLVYLKQLHLYIYIYIRIVVYRHKMQLKRCNSETIQILYVYHGPELLDLCLSVKRVALKGGGKKVVQIGHASAAQRRSCDGGERGPWRCERMFFGPKKPVKTKKFTTQGVGRVKCLIVLCWEMCVNGWVLRQWQYLPEGGFPFGWREGLMKFPSSRMGDNMCNGQFHAHTSKPVSFDRFWYLGSSAYFNGLMAFGIEGPCFRQGVWMKSWRK